MADFEHLLDDLDEPNDDIPFNSGGPTNLTAATEATVDDDDGSEPEVGQEWAVARQEAAIPVVLQEADDPGNDNHSVSLDKKIDEDDDADGSATANEVYEKLHTLWQQEHRCPELLAYNEDLMEQVQAQVNDQQDRVDELDASKESVDAIMANLLQIDLDRTKFAMSDMLSCRLAKIEEHPLHMRERVDFMNEAELSYLQQYGALMENHLRQTVLDHLPEAWQRLDEPQMIDRPNEETYYFWYVRDAIETDDGTENDAGTTLLAKYSGLKKHFGEGKVELLM